MKKWILLGLLAIAATGCASKQPDLKSPCVGAEGSPCERRTVNT
jgi:hypothetical protein